MPSTKRGQLRTLAILLVLAGVTSCLRVRAPAAGAAAAAAAAAAAEKRDDGAAMPAHARRGPDQAALNAAHFSTETCAAFYRLDDVTELDDEIRRCLIPSRPGNAGAA
ncbi:hypothetical protein O9K51_02704 [Purpureocillium lavendulum]|uniref:Uncharacterized protein n=1 Tax=Purpureocillium lavendulum TaxID=1247861 RepID=A0AB34FY86_9HYPO|nr:hypothetical protein O9K51_02704 [Purpureocillium lavendulum]